jgi:hypothetical protein
MCCVDQCLTTSGGSWLAVLASSHGVNTANRSTPSSKCDGAERGAGEDAHSAFANEKDLAPAHAGASFGALVHNTERRSQQVTKQHQFVYVI